MESRLRVAIAGGDPRLSGVMADRLMDGEILVDRYASTEELASAGGDRLQQTSVVLTPGSSVVGDELFDCLPILTGLVSPFTGVERFDRAAASARGILIANGQIDENVDSMAEATVLMLLAACYRLPESIAAMRGGAWPRPMARGRMLSRMTVGLVGYGRIAQGVGARLQPFGCRLLVHAPRLHAALPDGAEAVSLPRLVEESDAVLMLAALGPTTHHLLDAGLIARLKPGAIVINTARGGLIDEQALVAAAGAGKLGMLALDVFEQEPLPPDAPIRAVDDAILTPHTVGHTREAIARLPLYAVENVRLILRGEPPLSLFNPEALPIWRARLERVQ